MTTKLYKILFEETVIELDPETSDLFDRLDSHTDELEDELQKESLFEMIYEDVEISGDQLPDGEVVVVDPSFSPESLNKAASSYDSTLDDLITDPDILKSSNEKKPSVLMKEADRGGISQQQKIAKYISDLQTGIEAESNKKGSTKPDVVVKNARGAVLGQFEVKSAAGKQAEVTFFDSTVQSGGIGATVFYELLKEIAQLKNLKFFKKQGDKFVELAGSDKAAILADGEKLAEAMITVATSGGTSPGCGKYGDLDGPEWSDAEWYSVEEYIDNSSASDVEKKEMLQRWTGKWSTHKPAIVEGDVFFLPLRKGESVKNAKKTQARVYFWWEEEGNDIYKYVSIKGLDRSGKFLKLSPTKRESGDSGTLISSCFRVTKFDEKSSFHSNIKTTAAKIITDHFMEGGDTYFAIATPSGIKVFRTGNANPLRLVTKRDGKPPPVFNASHLLSAGVGTYGTGGPKKVRMGLKCHIDISSVPDLSAYTIGK